MSANGSEYLYTNVYVVLIFSIFYFQSEENDKNGKRVFKVSHTGLNGKLDGSFSFEADNDETLEKYVLNSNSHFQAANLCSQRASESNIDKFLLYTQFTSTS
jgi:hypothetical protein